MTHSTEIHYTLIISLDQCCLNGGCIQHIMKIMQPPSAVSFIIILESLWILIYFTHMLCLLLLLLLYSMVLHTSTFTDNRWILQIHNLQEEVDLIILIPTTVSQYETKSTMFLLPSQGPVSTLHVVKEWVLAFPYTQKALHLYIITEKWWSWQDWILMLLIWVSCPGLPCLFIILSRMCLSVAYQHNAVTWQVTYFYFLFILWQCW